VRARAPPNGLPISRTRLAPTEFGHAQCIGGLQHLPHCGRSTSRPTTGHGDIFNKFGSARIKGLNPKNSEKEKHFSEIEFGILSSAKAFLVVTPLRRNILVLFSGFLTSLKTTIDTVCYCMLIKPRAGLKGELAEFSFQLSVSISQTALGNKAYGSLIPGR
jgi:hypothetical protein